MIPTRRFVVVMIAFYEEGRVFRQGGAFRRRAHSCRPCNFGLTAYLRLDSLYAGRQ